MPKKREREKTTAEKPGLFEIAELFHEVSSERAAKTLSYLLENDEEFAGQYAELQEIAAIAGVSRDLEGWELEAVALHESAEKLIATEGWSDPAEVLGVAEDQEVEPDWIGLWRLCSARAESGGPHAETYDAVASKLHAISEKAREEAEFNERVKKQLDTVLEKIERLFPEPGDAEVFLTLLVLAYKRKHAAQIAQRKSSRVAHA